jgi:hypothetical protein
MADTLAVGSYEVRQADQKIPDRGQVGNKSTVKSALDAPLFALRNYLFCLLVKCAVEEGPLRL